MPSSFNIESNHGEKGDQSEDQEYCKCSDDVIGLGVAANSQAKTSFSTGFSHEEHNLSLGLSLS